MRRQIQQRKKSYTFTAIGISPAVDVAKFMLQNWGLQVEVTGSVTAWTVDLEVSIGGTTFKKIIRHETSDQSGEILWLQTPRPVDQIRFNLIAKSGTGNVNCYWIGRT